MRKRENHIARLLIIKIIFLSLIFSYALGVNKSITIQNDAQRKDVSGNIMDAHDGCLEFFNGRYYLDG